MKKCFAKSGTGTPFTGTELFWGLGITPTITQIQGGQGERTLEATHWLAHYKELLRGYNRQHRT